jgi:hypothetical protein
MKRAVLIALFALALVARGGGDAVAHAPCEDTGMPGHSDYGRSHVSSHTPHGPPDEHHNPGTHSGFSLCDPSENTPNQ